MKLEGKAQETMVKGDTADISQHCQHGWYEWLKFRDTPASFPTPKMQLGRYLGPSIDVGPAMTAKILKANGQVVHRSTYRALTEDEWASSEEANERAAFNKSVEDKLGPKMNPEDLVADDIETTTYERYSDDDGENHLPLPDEEETTPEAFDEFLNVHVVLPHKGNQVAGQVIGRKREADGTLRGQEDVPSGIPRWRSV